MSWEPVTNRTLSATPRLLSISIDLIAPLWPVMLWAIMSAAEREVSDHTFTPPRPCPVTTVLP